MPEKEPAPGRIDPLFEALIAPVRPPHLIEKEDA